MIFRGCLMFVFTLFFVAVFSMVAGYFMYTRLAKKSVIDMPSLIGLPEEQAVEVINDAGLSLAKMVPERDARFREGTITRQSPEPFKPVKIGRQVVIYVAAAIEKTTVPDLRGTAQDGVAFRLAGEELPVGGLTTVYHSSVPAGQVISTNPSAGSEVPKQTPVDLLISLGPSPVDYVMPDLSGMTKDEVQKWFAATALKIEFENAPVTDSGSRNKVITQQPKPGSRLGAEDNISLSIGRL